MDMRNREWVAPWFSPLVTTCSLRSDVHWDLTTGMVLRGHRRCGFSDLDQSMDTPYNKAFLHACTSRLT